MQLKPEYKIIVKMTLTTNISWYIFHNMEDFGKPVWEYYNNKANIGVDQF